MRRLPGRRDPALDPGARAYAREHAEEFVGASPRTPGPRVARCSPSSRATAGSLVGSIGLFPPRDGFAEAGYWTAPGHRGQGFTAEALRLLSGWAFDDVGVHRVELHVDPGNAGSRRVAERAGYSPEGLIRQRFLHRGQPSDVVLYALLPSDPRPHERR